MLFLDEFGRNGGSSSEKAHYTDYSAETAAKCVAAIATRKLGDLTARR